jgi:hypothetical protein
MNYTKLDRVGMTLVAVVSMYSADAHPQSRGCATHQPGHDAGEVFQYEREPL